MSLHYRFTVYVNTETNYYSAVNVFTRASDEPVLMSVYFTNILLQLSLRKENLKKNNAYMEALLSYTS